MLLLLNSKLYQKLAQEALILFIFNSKRIYKQVLALVVVNNSQVIVQPLGESYAVVTLPGNSSTNFQKKIENQSYVKAALPVLSRANRQDTIVLPNEIVLSFKPNTSDSEKESILKQNNLEIIRPLRFFPNVYIVKSTTASGTAILNVANQLNQIKAVNSASPNFLQSISNSIDIDNDSEDGTWSTESINKQPKDAANSENTTKDYLGLQWHLNSVPLKQCLQQRISSFDSLQNCLQQQTAKNKQSKSTLTSPRTDLRVTEAWKNSSGGKGVVVAVIDSLIQWNHPDLRDSLYKVEAADRCPREEYGWDFSEPSDSKNPCAIGDSDTRMSPLELNILRRKLQDTFKLSDKELIKRYLHPSMLQQINSPSAQKILANKLRQKIRNQIGGEFHGTLVSGVIAAKPQNQTGMWGVAPNAKILPVQSIWIKWKYFYIFIY